ncbi:hypothetical protein [Ehrlichia canis]|uniref:hypothetical protein n=1 Tax=Ehrlichia canis TaxID=944 RepID=UPI001F22A08F|nr:hypothetical protein [Ehrlichia canis]UKC53777.1 hypothetical protein s20019040002_000821 [Ehrlichia canis]UKC54715.1 hypothetical protein s20026770001_000821 [Ehrlichia canis]UKC55651.1 hypothetical protein s21009500007_000821 [Ehrlichia canis]
MDMINTFDNTEDDAFSVSNFINQNFISQFTITILPSVPSYHDQHIDENVYSVVFSYKKYETQQPYNLIEQKLVKFEASLDHDRLYLTKDDISIVLNEDMLNSCLSCIKVIDNKDSAQ